MQPQDNLSFLNSINTEIGVKLGQKRELVIEINKLNNRLERLDSDLEELLEQKRVLGKAQYSNPMIRKTLIQTGATSDEKDIRVAANRMEQMGLSEDQNNELTDAIIDYLILLDNNYRENNKNFIDPTMLLDKCSDSDKAGGESNDN